MELSAWYEGQFRTESQAYGFGGDRRLEPDDGGPAQPFADERLVAPGRDGHLPQVGQTADAAVPDIMHGLAAAVVDQAELLGQPTIRREGELLEHRRGEPDGLLAVQVAPQVGQPDLPGGGLKLMAEPVAARPGVLVGVVGREKPLALLPAQEAQHVVDDEGDEFLDGLGVLDYLEEHPLHAHEHDEAAGDGPVPGLAVVMDPHGHEVADDFLDGGFVGPGRFAVDPIDRGLHAGPLGEKVGDGVVDLEAQLAPLVVGGVAAGDVHVVFTQVNIHADVELRRDDLVVPDGILHDDLFEHLGFDLAGQGALAGQRGHELAQDGPGLEDHHRARALEFVVGVPQRGPLGHHGAGGVVEVFLRQLAQARAFGGGNGRCGLCHGAASAAPAGRGRKKKSTEAAVGKSMGFRLMDVGDGDWGIQEIRGWGI
ncbi:MAG: hypothetical protein NTV86_10345 [Planctomycetota bacterium]|nr:hypothetical protein [Planctomycetota bacterium]